MPNAFSKEYKIKSKKEELMNKEGIPLDQSSNYEINDDGVLIATYNTESEMENIISEVEPIDLNEISGDELLRYQAKLLQENNDIFRQWIKAFYIPEAKRLENEMISLKQDIKSIKSNVVFFAVLLVIFLILSLLGSCMGSLL
ncbi:MAG: hypothetical protein J7K85_07010 [Anaerolineaceae bacterium]|nr:hypothetical protein [Anaerolineaceae bacterium]